MALEIAELCAQFESFEQTRAVALQSPGLSLHRLRLENRQYAATGGISQLNQEYGFLPAFQDVGDRSTEISRFGDGRPAPVHLLDGLPDAWVVERSSSGQVVSVKDSVIAGFLRQNRFYTREQAARAVKVMNLDN